MLQKWKKQGIYEEELTDVLAVTRSCCSVFQMEVCVKSTFFLIIACYAMEFL